jgi:predicted nucleotidyltransferase component of viral defense system
LNKKPKTNLAASVRSRLLKLNEATRQDYNAILTRYCLERLLYRLSVSKHRDKFILKGAMLFAVWQGSPHRQTRDLDLLGFGDSSQATLKDVFRDFCNQAVDDDGVTFDPDAVSTGAIRDDAEYGGVRVKIIAHIGEARISLQVDVGFGDVLTPQPQEESYPCLLGMPAPVLRCYARETVVAEKLAAIIKLGDINTRYKDYFDLLFLSERFNFDGPLLREAIEATLKRRGWLDIATAMPDGLLVSFGTDPVRSKQWAGFCEKSKLAESRSLAEVVQRVADFVISPLEAITKATPFTQGWIAGGPWK